jgi:hypothetical protein
MNARIFLNPGGASDENQRIDTASFEGRLGKGESSLNLSKMGEKMEFCCEVFANHIKEGFLKEKGYFVSGEEGVAPSEKSHYFTEISVFDKVEAKTIKMPLSFCPFCGEKLGE